MMAAMDNCALRIALPSGGALSEPSVAFMRSCGLAVSRANSRRYVGEVRSVPGVSVIFQRGSDIAANLDGGAVDMGIVGEDQFTEHRREDGGSRVVLDRLGFGGSSLVIAVPDSWVDVTSISDLADVCMEFRNDGRDLRVATKYPRIMRRHLLAHGVNHFTLVRASGALEAAPAMGFADIIGDISESGTTIKENRLKTIDGGTAMTSEACVVSRRMDAERDARRIETARVILEMMEARLQARGYVSVTANMKGESADRIADRLLKSSDISGLRGPTISEVFAPDEPGWFAVTVIIEEGRLMAAVDRLREIGGGSVTVSKPDYVFQSACESYARLTA